MNVTVFNIPVHVQLIITLNGTSQDERRINCSDVELLTTGLIATGYNSRGKIPSDNV